MSNCSLFSGDFLPYLGNPLIKGVGKAYVSHHTLLKEGERSHTCKVILY
jgi:hypothetical protein